MLRIPCPHCGWRDEGEFRYAGPAGLARPETAAVAAWVSYLYRRSQPPGEQEERWLHASGCLRWLRVRRDTRTNSIVSVTDE